MSVEKSPFLVEQFKWYAVTGWRLEMAHERTFEAALFGACFGFFLALAAFALFFGAWGHAIQTALIAAGAAWFVYRVIRKSREHTLKNAERPLVSDNPNGTESK